MIVVLSLKGIIPYESGKEGEKCTLQEISMSVL
jgi:hypothetical protein